MGATKRPDETEDSNARREAEDRFVEDLTTRGEAVPEGAELPPGATHEIVHADDEKPDDRPIVRRKRFSAT